MRMIRAFIIAFSTYSRIPMPRVEWSEENRRCSMCFFPLIGAAIGLLLALWIWLCQILAVGGMLKGAVAALIPVLVTGGIHLDGFMDTMDAMSSWQTRERRLEILKDSHVGAFAVIGCCGYLLASAGLYSELNLRDCAAMGACFVISRALSALALIQIPGARAEGMLADVAKASGKRAVAVACGIYILACCPLLLMSGWRGSVALLVAGVCLAHYRGFSLKHFGGLTGDLAGWFVQISEFACLLVITIGGKIA